MDLFGQEGGIRFYSYDYPGFPDIEKEGGIKIVDELVHAVENKSLNYYELAKSNIISNDYYYDFRNNIEKTKKIAIEVDWKKVEMINIIIEQNYSTDSISLLSNGGTSHLPTMLLGSDSITTHFIHNRIERYFALKINSNTDITNKREKLKEVLEDVYADKVKLVLEIKYRRFDFPVKYRIIPRNAGLGFQFQRKIDLSFSYVNDDLVGNIFIALPFRIRTRKPTASAADFRWIGDVISFGPTFVVENSSTKPEGVGGFLGLGLSESGQMILGISGGWIFTPHQTKTFIGLSYNALGFIEGLVDLVNDKPAWKQKNY